MWNCVCGKYIYVFGIVGRPRQVSTPEPCGGGVAPALLPTPSGGAPQGGAGRAAAPPPNLSIGGM